jgi:hypothetical protein
MKQDTLVDPELERIVAHLERKWKRQLATTY